MSESQLVLYMIAIVNISTRRDLEKLLRTHIDSGPLRRVVYGIVLDRLSELGPSS